MDPTTRQLSGWKVTIKVHLPKEVTAVSGIRFILTECYPNRMTWAQLLSQKPEIPIFNPANYCIEALRHRPQPQRHDMNRKIGELLKCYQIHSMVRPYSVYIIGKPISMAAAAVPAPPLVANNFQLRQHRPPPPMVNISMPNIQQEIGQENIFLVQSAPRPPPKNMFVIGGNFVRQPMGNFNGPMRSFANCKLHPKPQQPIQQQQPRRQGHCLRMLLEQQKKRQRLEFGNIEAAAAAAALIQLQHRQFLQPRNLPRNVEVGQQRGINCENPIAHSSGSQQRVAMDMRVDSRRTPQHTEDEHWATVDFVSGQRFNLF